MKKIGRILILIGIILIVIPIIGKDYIAYEKNRRYMNYLQQITSSICDETQMRQNKEQEQEKKQEQMETNVTDQTIKLGEVIGRIQISKVNIDLLLTEGVGEEALQVGAGHMEDTALPGRAGNCVIAGHRNYIFGSMFNRLDEVEIGDFINVEFQGETYGYKIDQVMIVEPENLSVLEQQIESKSITLITCYPEHSSKYRLIIKGQFKEED